MTVQKFNQLAVDANAMSKTRPNLDTLGLLMEEMKAIRRVLGASLGGTGAGLLCGSATFDPAANADAAGETTTVTVTGAALGDMVIGVSFSLDLQSYTVTAYVSAADTVSVRFQNESGAAPNIASGTLRVLVLPSRAIVSANGAALSAMTLTQTAGTSS